MSATEDIRNGKYIDMKAQRIKGTVLDLPLKLKI
jgi:hypothetical protein